MLIATLFALTAAVLHAGWNLIAKRSPTICGVQDNCEGSGQRGAGTDDARLVREHDGTVALSVRVVILDFAAGGG
jgi:hypothetical protein